MSLSEALGRQCRSFLIGIISGALGKPGLEKKGKGGLNRGYGLGRGLDRRKLRVLLHNRLKWKFILSFAALPHTY